MSAEKPHQADTGAIFPNSEKWIAAGTNRPQHSGEASTACQACGHVSRWRLAAWNKIGKKSGEPLISLKFNVPENDKAPAPAPAEGGTP